jgi:hypothetical protein
MNASPSSTAQVTSLRAEKNNQQAPPPPEGSVSNGRQSNGHVSNGHLGNGQVELTSAAPTIVTPRMTFSPAESLDSDVTLVSAATAVTSSAANVAPEGVAASNGDGAPRVVSSHRNEVTFGFQYCCRRRRFITLTFLVQFLYAIMIY